MFKKTDDWSWGPSLRGVFFLKAGTDYSEMTSEVEGCPVNLVPPDNSYFRSIKKWPQWIKPTWLLSAWTSARHWAAKARISSSPSQWALTSPSSWTQGFWLGTFRPTIPPRRSQAHRPSKEMPGVPKQEAKPCTNIFCKDLTAWREGSHKSNAYRTESKWRAEGESSMSGESN